MSVLELSGVSKRFGGLQALSEVSLSVSSGEVLGFIGPNGGGKSRWFPVLRACCVSMVAQSAFRIAISDGYRHTDARDAASRARSRKCDLRIN